MPAEHLNDPTSVARQYASTDNLATRRAVWGPGPEGVSPVDVLREAALAGQPRGILEIGCGTGQFARSVLDVAPDAEYVATDASGAMVEAARELGLTAQCARAESLPFADDTFDVVVAGWMLYHVEDLDRALAEVRRVLRPGGTFAAATSGERHLADLLIEAGGAPLVTQFSSENGDRALRQHFTELARRDVTTWATFADHAAAAAYLETFDPALGDILPQFDGPRRYDGFTTVFTCR